jgi:hypothetical protein
MSASCSCTDRKLPGDTAECHCTGSDSVRLPLAVWDRYAGFLADRYPHLDECAPDGGGVPLEVYADLVSARPRGVQIRRQAPPFGGAVYGGVLREGQGSQVLWAVVGPIAVDVVHVLLDRDPAADYPVLVGVDVLPYADPPRQADVTVRGDVPSRLVRRDLLAGSKPPTRSDPLTDPSARSAAATLPSSLDRGPAADTGDQWHGLSLQVTALCGRHFSSPAAFDAHWQGSGDNRHCVDPATLVYGPTSAKAGKPKFELRDRASGLVWVTASEGENPYAVKRRAEADAGAAP